MSRIFLGIVAACAAAAVAASAAEAGNGPSASPIARLPFPERGYVLDLPYDAEVTAGRLRVAENGRPVRLLTVTPLAESGLRSGVVLAIDASESMAGAPVAAAMAAVRDFIAHRPPGQHIGLLVFNGGIDVLREPTEDERSLATAIETSPALSYGTRIFDGIEQSIDVLKRSRLSTGAVVVLSDGADLGSSSGLEDVIAAARRHHIRVFTVGLRSKAFDPGTLRTIAETSGGTYTEARTTHELGAVYRALGDRLAREYVVQYRSDAKANAPVTVEIAVAGIGTAEASYIAPTPSRAAPYHRSLATRFLLSPASTFALALVAAALIAWTVTRLIRRPQSGVLERIAQFSSPQTDSERSRPAAALRRRYAGGWWARLERDLEIARIERSPREVVAWTGAAMLGVLLVLAIASKLVAVLALLTPFAARALIQRKLRRTRNEFGDQLPTNLQVLASALRAGHSFNGALGVVVENAHEPARAELQRILRDDQLGVPPEQAIRRVAERMANRDLEQVALLAELQRTSGGNAAEVLDTVVSTVRERSELRRLVRTLTAQGRMARWILTALPVGLCAFLFLVQPEIMSVLVETTGGQIALVIAAVLVISGSLVIQRIIEIDV